MSLLLERPFDSRRLRVFAICAVAWCQLRCSAPIDASSSEGNVFDESDLSPEVIEVLEQSAEEPVAPPLGLRERSGVAPTLGPGHVVDAPARGEHVRGSVVFEALVAQTGGDGELDRETVARELRRRLPMLRGCYERSLRARPDLAGSSRYRITIVQSGRVSASTVHEGLDDELDRCIATMLGRLRFNPGAEGGSANYAFDLSFAPSAESESTHRGTIPER